MKKEENKMITKFNKLFEQDINLEDVIVNVENEKKEFTDKIKHDFSIITYKKANSPKSIRIREITGYFNKRDFKNIKLLYNTSLIVSMTNGDKIIGKLSVYQNENENNINIKINDKLIYDLDNKEFNNEIFVDKLITKYKESLLEVYKRVRL
jgi:hypothetical protein